MIRILLLIIISISSAACSTGLFSVHKIDIQQGNALDDEAIAKIHPGMTREAVVELLGNPVLQPILNKNRWEYVYYLKKPDVPAERKKLIVYFEDDRVESIKR